MRIRIRETKTVTLDVTLSGRATQEQVIQEMKKQKDIILLESPTLTMGEPKTDIWAGGEIAQGNKLATCEAVGEPKIEREVLLD